MGLPFVDFPAEQEATGTAFFFSVKKTLLFFIRFL